MKYNMNEKERISEKIIFELLRGIKIIMLTYFITR